MKAIDLPGKIRTVLDLLRAEDFNHQVVLIGELRRELDKISPRFASVDSLAEWIRALTRQLSRFPSATPKEVDDALRHEEQCIHAERERLDFHDTAASIGPVVTIAE